MSIAVVHGRQVWDSRGRPTIEVEVKLEDGSIGRAIAPSGASTGRREALDKRDGGTRLGGFGVNAAIAAVNGPLAAELRGMAAADQSAIDAALIALDGTPQKTALGGNGGASTGANPARPAARRLAGRARRLQRTTRPGRQRGWGTRRCTPQAHPA